MLISFLLLQALAHAMPGDGARDFRPRCNFAVVNACINEHRNAQQGELGRAASFDGQTASLQKELTLIASRSQIFHEEWRSLNVTKNMAEAEIGADLRREKRRGENIFPQGPAPEDIFLLGNASGGWGEQFGAERRDRLKALVGQVSPRMEILGPVQRKLAMEISGLEEQIRVAQNAKEQALKEADSHGYMCQSGCEMQICPQR